MKKTEYYPVCRAKRLAVATNLFFKIEEAEKKIISEKLWGKQGPLAITDVRSIERAPLYMERAKR